MPEKPQSLRVPAYPYKLETPGAAANDCEWVLSMGNGGFAMGTASGVNRRKYHALLIASANPPVERVSCLTGLDEEAAAFDGGGTETGRFKLFSRRFAGDKSAPQGSRSLVRFEKTPTLARWVYEFAGARLTKELKVAWRRNACAVRYSLRTGDSGSSRVSLSVTPRVSLRDFHATNRDAQATRWEVQVQPGGFRVTAAGHTLRIVCERAQVLAEPSMLNSVHLDMETERHQEDVENVFSPGRFIFESTGANDEQSFTIAAAMAPDEPDLSLFNDESRERHLAAVRQRFSGAGIQARSDAQAHPALEALGPLVDAADDFLVPRTVGGKKLMTVLAGFPWFADWGRDTMISLFGLMLTTRRFDDARGCLETFARHVKDGLIPNLFDDYGGPPQYNTADASLWFLHACCEYLNASADRATFDSLLLPACLDIIDHHRRGTHFGIRMDPEDGLITAGDETTQLTWMDAKRDGVVFTPRHGKAVEINALWHHGLLCVAEAIESGGAAFQGRPGAGAATPADLRALASRVSESFRAKFWFEAEQRLHDCLQQDSGGSWKPVPHIRPNQIFAVSLKHSPLSPAQQRAVVETVRRHLLTPVGLRTLAPSDPGYRGRFEGNMMSRDGAYHNGTVWPWLIGPYCEAVLRVNDFSAAAKAEVRSAIQPLIDSMSGTSGGCLGQIAEVFDGDEPRRPQGCVAQAWSVAEILRIAAMVMK